MSEKPKSQDEKKEGDQQKAESRVPPGEALASDIMDTKYPFVDISKQIGDAHLTMSERRLECLPVVKDQKVVRVITLNNLEVIRSPHFDAVGQSDRIARMMCLPLSAVNQSQKLVAAKPGDPLKDVIGAMVANKINAVPILGETGEYVGMVTTHMILKYYGGF